MKTPFSALTNKIDAPSGQTTIFAIFLPFFIESVLSNTIGLVSTLILNGYSAEAVGTIGTANQVFGLSSSVYSALATGGAITMSHCMGIRDTKRFNELANSLLVSSAVLSFLMGALMSVFSIPLLKLMNLQGEALAQASSYFRIVAASSVMIGLFNAISAILRSYNYQRFSVFVTIFMNVINIILSYLVVYQPGILPFSGIDGIAIANVISRLIGLAIMLGYLLLGPVPFRFLPKLSVIGRHLPTILRYSIPSAVMSFSYNASQTVTTSILVSLGMEVVSVKIYLTNIFHYVYLAGYSLAQAHALVVGWYVGAGRVEDATRLNRQNQHLVWLLNGTLSGLICLCGPLIMRSYTQVQSLRDMAQIVMILDILVEINRGTNHIQESFLRGAGDIKYSMIVSVVAEWIVIIPLVYLLGVKLGFGLAGCWLGFAIDEGLRGTLLFLRVRSGKWKLHIA